MDRILSLFRRHMEAGHEVIPLCPGTKVPAFPFKDINLIRDRIEHLIRRGYGYAVMMRERVVALDGDDFSACEWAEREFPPTPMKVRTHRGMHYYYRPEPNASFRPTQGLDGNRIDVKAGNTSLVGAGNRIKDRVYELIGDILPASELPVLPFERFRKEVKPLSFGKSPLRPDRVEWAREILFSEYYSIEGCGGDMQLFRAACFLLQRAKLDYRTALRLLSDWNSDGLHAVPSWPQSRLEYKLREARRLMK